ncbi:hypothetical protein TWF132_010687 [Orbilia oligospora]|nr:hypothetical protein TWF132_010687 [Orbilia oligospora]
MGGNRLTGKKDHSQKSKDGSERGGLCFRSPSKNVFPEPRQWLDRGAAQQAKVSAGEGRGLRDRRELVETPSRQGKDGFPEPRAKTVISEGPRDVHLHRRQLTTLKGHGSGSLAKLFLVRPRKKRREQNKTKQDDDVCFGLSVSLMFPETGFTGVEVCRELCLKAGSKHTPSAQFAGTNRQASGLCRYPENEKKRISNVENPTRQCTKCGKFAKLVEVGFFYVKANIKRGGRV